MTKCIKNDKRRYQLLEIYQGFVLFCFLFLFLFFAGDAYQNACGILAPRSGIEPAPAAVEPGVLTTGPLETP